MYVLQKRMKMTNIDAVTQTERRFDSRQFRQRWLRNTEPASSTLAATVGKPPAGRRCRHEQQKRQNKKTGASSNWNSFKLTHVDAELFARMAEIPQWPTELSAPAFALNIMLQTCSLCQNTLNYCLKDGSCGTYRVL